MYFVCVILFCYVIASTTATGLNPRSVNLNLETVLQFDPEDNSADAKFIDHIQQFLGKVKTVIDNKPSRRSYNRPEPIKFTDFIRNAILILKTYSDDDLEDVFNVIDHEVRKYHYKGCKFHELVQNEDLRRYVASKLSTVKNEDGKSIKKSLNDVLDALDDAKFDYKHSELLDYIDSLYRNNDVGKMKSLLNQLKTYRVKSKRANLDLIRIVRNGIRGLIFDHYSNLNPNARRELRIRIESFWHRDKDVTTTEATTTKKKFDIANGFNFLRDFTFEFITPESYTTKPTKISQSIEEFVDETRLKKNKSPEVMPNYTDNEEIKEKSTEKPKKKEKKKNKHKKNKEHKKKRTRVTVADDSLAPKRKHKSKKHNGELVFRQQDVRPMNVFDYKAVINVKGQTDESNSNEVWNPNESVSSDMDKLKSKNFRPRHFRKNVAQNSEEGLSIDFTPSPMHQSLNTEPTTKQDDLLRRFNNLEQVVETFKSKTDNENTKEIKVTPNIIKETATTDEATEINESPAQRRSPVALPYVKNTERIPLWKKISHQDQATETVTKTYRPPLFVQDSNTIETIPTGQRQSHQFRNIETTPAWKPQSHKSTIDYEKNLSDTTTEEIYTTTAKVTENQSQSNDIANTTDQNYFRANQNDSNEVIQRANNIPKTNYTNSEKNDIDNENIFDKSIGKYNLTKNLLENFKENFDNITIMTKNDLPTAYRADNKEEINENKNNESTDIINTSEGTNEISRKIMADASNESSAKMVAVREKLQKHVEAILEKQNKGSGIRNAIERSNSLIHEFDL